MLIRKLKQKSRNQSFRQKDINFRIMFLRKWKCWGGSRTWLKCCSLLKQEPVFLLIVTERRKKKFFFPGVISSYIFASGTQPELNKHLSKLIETMFKKMLSYSMGLKWRLTNKSVLIHIDSTEQYRCQAAMIQTQQRCHLLRPQGFHDSWPL